MPRLTATVVFLASALAGCGVVSDPATPCAAMDLGHAREGILVTPKRAPIVAVTSDYPFVLHEICDDGACYVQREPLDGLSSGSMVLLTSTGQYAVAIDRAVGTVHSYAISSEPDQNGRAVTRRSSATQGEHQPTHLIAGMRGNDYVVTRSANGALGRYDPDRGTAEPIAAAIDNLKVIAVGERYLVGRQIHSAGEESLYLVPVHPELGLRAAPVRLDRGPTFSRVLLTPGDERVVATSGEGSSATTLVYSVSDGRRIDRFAGAAVSGRRAGEEVPGLRGVSPDGSHLAFRTPTGALAMRDLDAQASCLVRSSVAGDHQVAGFAPNGVLYMEAAEGVGTSRLLAFDPITLDLVALGESGSSYHLAAVAAAMPGEPEQGVHEGRESMQHWAVAVQGGSYSAISASGPSKPLGLGDVSFMARDDGGVWLLDTEHGRANGANTLAVRRIAPTVDDHRLRFPLAKDAGPAWLDGAVEHTAFETELPSARDVCVSTGIPGAWAVRCSDGPIGSTYLSTNSGQTEDPQQKPETEPADPQAPG